MLRTKNRQQAQGRARPAADEDARSGDPLAPRRRVV